MSDFKKQVIKVVSLIPYGKVVSYGQVALYVGMPRAARQVGWILNQLEERVSVPWWRVVNNQGRISIKGSKYSAEDQKKLLLQEGIQVSQDLAFDMDKYRFTPDSLFIKRLELDPIYLGMLSKKVPYSKGYKNDKKAKLQT